MDYRTYSDDLLPAIVRFWNRAFAGFRNFWPIGERHFKQRVVAKKTAVEAFDPKGFIVAVEGGEVLGAIHVGIRPEELCRALFPEWPGGTQGYIALLAVDPARRRQGIGSELWHRGHGVLTGVGQIALDGQCINPFYGNSEGPLTPFFGTPEGIGVPWKDSATKKFLARHGYGTKFKGVQLELAVEKSPLGPQATPTGFELKISDGFYPEVGVPYGTSARYLAGMLYECVAAVTGGKTAAVMSYFPLGEVGPGRFAIYEALVLEDFQGRGLGRALLAAVIERMRAQGAERCDVLTIPEISDAAYKLYQSAGFTPVAEWAVY